MEIPPNKKELEKNLALYSIIWGFIFTIIFLLVVFMISGEFSLSLLISISIGLSIFDIIPHFRELFPVFFPMEKRKEEKVTLKYYKKRIRRFLIEQIIFAAIVCVVWYFILRKI